MNLTECIGRSLDKIRFGCGIFVDLQKAFDTVDHSILQLELEYYGICSISNDWLNSLSPLIGIILI